MKSLRMIACVMTLFTFAAATTVGHASATGASVAIEEWSHPAGWKFWLPDNWKVNEDGNHLIATDKAEEVYVEFFVPKNIRQLDRALDELDEEMAARLKDIKYDSPPTSSEDGVDEIFITGHAIDRADGEEIEFDLGIYEKEGRLLIVFGATSAENFDRYDRQFRRILDSIR